MDKGHADSYRLFHLIHKKNAFFVTQAKDNMRFDTRLFPRKSQPISLWRVYSDLKTSKGQQCFRSKNTPQVIPNYSLTQSPANHFDRKQQFIYQTNQHYWSSINVINR
jgi:hypothetical protein